MINPPSNFQYNVMNQSLSWDSVPDAIEYEIAHRPLGETEWTTVYSDGNSNQIPFSVSAGKEEVKGKTSKNEGSWGVWGAIEIVTVP